MDNKEIVAERTKDFAIRHGKDFAARGAKTILFTVVRAFIAPILVISTAIFVFGFILGALIF